MSQIALSEIFPVKVRFSEVDSLRVVWHGHYVKYLEEGREAFGRKYGVAYMNILDAGILAPLVKVNIDFKKPLKYGDTVLVETRYTNCETAKIILEYTLTNEKTGEVIATGETIQVFLDHNWELMLNLPAFYVDWKKKWGLM